MDDFGGTVTIDLGLERGEPPTYSSPRVRTTPLWVPAALLAALVLVCGAGSVPPPRSPLSAVFQLRVGPADSYATTADGQLLAETFGLLTSYDLTSGRLRWQAGQSTPAYRLRISDDVVLMRPWAGTNRDPGTTALSTFSGTDLWERPGNVVNIAGSSTLLAVDSPRTLDGTGRRVQGQVDAIDPATGNTRWSVPVPSTAVLLGVPGLGDEESRMLLVHDNQTMAVHDLTTGKLIASTHVPAADYSPDNPVVAGGRILLRHPGASSAEISAYDPETLKQLWSEPSEIAYQMQPCGLLVCLGGPAGLRAIDPDTGDTVWAQPAWHSLALFGDMYVAYSDPDGSVPVGVIDPRTGALRIQLAGWQPVDGTGNDGRLVLTRAADAESRTMVAVARPGDLRPRVLDALPQGTGDCQAAPARLVCRTIYGELVVWAYQEE
ncbi:PQQ-binding-like beta-propeller repeat protein [Actinoplanes subtropicus]|uniref:outer membrane protein assembly factor BamB family protein n=1 Tax=Actinoplanes subtropicus TaxID=543632 RepID=UPI0004C3D407|nr:PQQ-binding-like beta-propeller repeat protein [Actinoplanes subtropicus]